MIDSDMDYPLVENNCSENKMANCIFINRFLNNTINVDILWMIMCTLIQKIKASMLLRILCYKYGISDETLAVFY